MITSTTIAAVRGNDLARRATHFGTAAGRVGRVAGVAPPVTATARATALRLGTGGLAAIGSGATER